MDRDKPVIDFVNAAKIKLERRRRKQLVNLALIHASKVLDFPRNRDLRKTINQTAQFACFSKRHVENYSTLRDHFTQVITNMGGFDDRVFGENITLLGYQGILLTLSNYEKKEEIKGQYFTYAHQRVRRAAFSC